MKLELNYNGRLEVLPCRLENETLIPEGKWAEPEIEYLGAEDDASSQNESQLTSSSDEYLRQIFSDIQNCEPQERRIALKKLYNRFSLKKEATPPMIYDCVPVVMDILQSEEVPLYRGEGEKSEKEICLDIMCKVLHKGGPQGFLEKGCLPVVLECFKFTSYSSATEIWNNYVFNHITTHLTVEHIEKVIPILENNIQSEQYVNSAVAYNAYADFVDEFVYDGVVLGKLLNYKVVQNMHEALKNPIWQNSDTTDNVIYVLRIACESIPQYILELHKMDITSTLCFLLTNSSDISTGKLQLLDGIPYRTELILAIIKMLIPSCKLRAYKIRKMEELIDCDTEAFVERLKKKCLEPNPISEELTKWLKKQNELTFRWIGTLFRLTQEIFLKTSLLEIKLSCIECLELLIMYDDEAWKSFFKSQDVTEELAQLLSLKKYYFVDRVLNLVSMLLDIAPELCAQQFLQNGLRERIVASTKRNKDENQMSCRDKKAVPALVTKKFVRLASVCNDLLPNGNNNSNLMKLQAAISSINTRESADIDSLEEISQIIQEECIDVYDLAHTGLVRSLLYFLTGVDTKQLSVFQSTPPSELIFSLDDIQKHERDTRIKMFLKVFLGFSADSLCSAAVSPDEEKPFIKLLKLLMTSFTIPKILEGTTAIDNTEIDVLEKCCQPNSIDGPCIYQNGPKHVLDEYLVPYLLQYLSTDDLSSEIAALLSVLYGINKYHRYLYADGSCSPLVFNSHFINRQLSWDIEQQVNEPHDSDSTVLPSFMWKIMFACPFLITFKSRLLAIQKHTEWVIVNCRLKERISIPHLLPHGGKTCMTISRRHIIEESKLFFSSPLVCLNSLDVNFKYETPEAGPGVRREYYSLISKELQNSQWNMWKDDTGASSQNVIDGKATQRYVINMHGLYPKPSSGDVQLSNFKLLGKLMAKALVDQETLDVNLHECLYKLLLRDDYNVELEDLISLDPILGGTIKKMQEIVAGRMQSLTHLNTEDKPLVEIQKELSVLKLDGVAIEDLCLDFTLPGYLDVELMKGGKHVSVNLDNLQQYVELVVEWFMKKGVWKQIMEIRKGFNCFFPTNVLKVFYPEELNKVFCGSFGNQTLLLKRWISMCNTCEGYTKKSHVVKFLSQIVSEYDTNQQKDFLMFVSGFPRLVLDDKNEFTTILEISRCPVRDGCDPDEYLPRAATCFTILMLPDYSSIDIMRKKLDLVLAEAKMY